MLHIPAVRAFRPLLSSDTVTKTAKPRAIDLYSGVGGWSLGLAMGGIQVVASYEWWPLANNTNATNNRHQTFTVDIRGLRLEDLPTNVDIVVGSPPCTEFSYSNRGGKGDIANGLKDIEKYLAVVDYVKPKFWAMENVPRVADILRKELGMDGSLRRFAHLNPRIEVFEMSEFGVPQRRQRCIAGNFDFALLHRYKDRCKQVTLGNVLDSLKSDPVIDPVFGVSMPRNSVTEQQLEEVLSDEEERMNRDAKTFHPVYNNMAFPDPMDRPVRTITATCTRVSRESVVVPSETLKGKFRRLTLRERACLQGFPISYQFYGESYAQKLKMVGNAVPPVFTFYIAQAMRGVSPGRLRKLPTAIKGFRPPKDAPATTTPDTPGRTFPVDRRFRAAIPELRFKSGVRFELANEVNDRGLNWCVRFFFGNSKSIQEVCLDTRLERALESLTRSGRVKEAIDRDRTATERVMKHVTPERLQLAWSHRDESALHPFVLVDRLGKIAADLIEGLSDHAEECEDLIVAALPSSVTGFQLEELQGLRKVQRNAPAVVAGCLLGIWVNRCLGDSGQLKVAA